MLTSPAHRTSAQSCPTHSSPNLGHSASAREKEKEKEDSDQANQQVGIKLQQEELEGVVVAEGGEEETVEEMVATIGMITRASEDKRMRMKN